MAFLSSLLVLASIAHSLDANDDETSPGPYDALPQVGSYGEAVAGSPPIEHLERRRWIRHRIRHRERVSQIAARYGVRRDKLVEWNSLDPQQPYPPKRRRSLKVLTRRIVPPRVQVRYIPDETQTWGDVATALRVEIPDLHAWNWRQRRIRPGRAMQAWVDPAVVWSYRPGGGPPVPDGFDVPPGGLSAGRPHRGRLIDGVQLPESPLYTRGIRRVLWGSSHTIEQLQIAFANFRHDTGFEHEIIVGSISRRGGRRLPPHRSHQSGRDVDIRLPLMAGVPATDHPNADEIDWYATWGLIKALGDTEEVTVVFLEADLHRRVYEAARVMGAEPEALADYLIFPRWRPKSAPLVRHSDGHDEHIHVRFKCGAAEPRCKTK